MIRYSAIVRYHREFSSMAVKYGIPAVTETFMTNIGTLVLGMFVGSHDLNDSYAAYSLAYNVFNAISAIIASLYVGITIVLLRSSAREHDDHNSVATGCILVSAAASLALCVAMFISANGIIKLLYGNTEQHVFDSTVVMFRYFTIAMFFQLTVRALNAAYRGVGNFKIPVAIMITESFITAFGGYLFVAYLEMGTFGIILTLIVSRLIPFLIIHGVFLSGKSVICFQMPEKKHFKNTAESIKIGAPAMLESGGVQISYLILQSILVYVGTNALKGYQAANSVINFIYVISSGMNVALITVAGKYFAQMKLRKTKSCAWYFTFTTYAAAGTAGILCAIFPQQVISLFLKSGEAKEIGSKILTLLCLNLILTTFIQVMSGLFKAIGKTSTVFFIGVTGSVCVRLPLAWLFIIKLQLGYYGIILALTIDFLYRFVFYAFKTYFLFRRPIHARLADT